MTGELDKPIGTKETVKLTAGSVIVDTVSIEPPKEGSKAKLVVFHLKHPDREEPLKISNIQIMKIQGNNKTIKKETLWYNEDDDGNIRKGSAVAQLMAFYKMPTLKSFVGQSLTTEHDASSFLTIKAY